MYNEGRKGGEVLAPPRFAIGGSRATIDPRNASVAELYPLASHKLEIPPGWEKIHQYVYVLQPTTDEHGWQYRSEWSSGPIGEEDEAWVKTNAEGLDVRRRLWMTTVVKRDDVVNAKRKLAEALQSRVRGVIMEGELYRQEQGLMKSWQKRYVYLTDDTIEFYSGGSKETGGKKIAEVPIGECEVKMLFGVQCPGRDFAFSIRRNNELVALLDADTREVRRRWVVAISYQLALLSPEINFSPFDYGPQTGEEAAKRVLMCGDLQKQGHVIRNWKKRFFQLNPRELQYYDKEVLKGSMPILGSMLTPGAETSCEFSLRSDVGKVLVMRADNVTTKATWIRALTRQIHRLHEQEKQKLAAAAEPEPEQVADETVAAAAQQEEADNEAEWHQKNKDGASSAEHETTDAAPIKVVGYDEDASTTAGSTDEGDSKAPAEEEQAAAAEEDEDDVDPTEAKVIAANIFLKAFILNDHAAFESSLADGVRLVCEAFEVDALGAAAVWDARGSKIHNLLKMPEEGGGLMGVAFPDVGSVSIATAADSVVTGSLPVSVVEDDSLCCSIVVALNPENKVTLFQISDVPVESLPKPVPEPEVEAELNEPEPKKLEPITTTSEEVPAAASEDSNADDQNWRGSAAPARTVPSPSSSSSSTTSAAAKTQKAVPVTERFKGFAPTSASPAVAVKKEKVERLVRRRDSIVANHILKFEKVAAGEGGGDSAAETTAAEAEAAPAPAEGGDA